ncbi:hypothetical protein [Micromonospora sp. NPDC048830]|uniref:hypothetical protein n=1 Tax=Micromonospora sp. NPDC048830 TaxID=3364257 RepID=UPI0037244062
MRPLHLQSEAYRPEGGIDARSQRRTLGRPALDFFDLFLRETLQNSWDARIGEGPVHFSIDAWRTTADQRSVLRDLVFKTVPSFAGPGEILRSEDVNVLVVTDTGTRGLTGPTRADLATDVDSNFIDLVRNTGRDERKGLASGTYGFGKAVLFEASACSTVVVYSRTIFSGVPIARLIAMTLGNPYEDAGRRYTGRHWWGVAGRNLVEPLEGPPAEELAAALGLNRLPNGATGTSLMVLAPSTDDAPLRDVVARLAEAATAHAWPHMVSTAIRKPDIICTFTCDSETLAPPDPTTDPRLRHHVEAYRRCEDLLAGRRAPEHAWPWAVEEVRSQRPDRRLGVIAHRDYPYNPDGNHDAVPAEVALMRSPRFVVRYMPVKPAPSGQATAGVFLAAPELDSDFARSEPASHDEWRPANLGLARNQRNPVRQALEQIKARFRRHTIPVTATQATHHRGTVSLASRLGRLLDGTVAGTDPRIPAFPEHGGSVGSATGSSTPFGPHNGSDRTGEPGNAQAGTNATGQGADARAAHAGSGSSGAQDGWIRQRNPARRPRAWLDPTVNMMTVDGATAVQFSATVVVPEGNRGAIVRAEPYVLVDGGKESEPPAGADVPHIISWRETTTEETQHGHQVALSQPGTSHWIVTVSQPPDTAVSLRLEARAATP